jgi:hypothetical protein
VVRLSYEARKDSPCPKGKGAPTLQRNACRRNHCPRSERSRAGCDLGVERGLGGIAALKARKIKFGERCGGARACERWAWIS